jgi:hypothetical protein
MFSRTPPAQEARLELRFGATSTEQRETSSLHSPTRLIQDLDEAFAAPPSLLHEALLQIQVNNQTALAPARRLKLLAAASRRVWPTLAAMRDDMRKHDDGIPEAEAQQQLLGLADRLIAALILGFQVAIEADYRSDDQHGGQERDRILTASVRILELVHLRQRLRALRYQPLPGASWQTSNTLFCLLARSDSLTTPVLAMTDDRLLLDGSGQTDASRVYAAIQAFGLFDICAWSKRQQRFLDTYCAALPDAVTISYSPNKTAGRDVRFTHAHADAAAHPTPASNDPHRIVVDFGKLVDAVRQDKNAGTHPLRHQPGGTATCLASLAPLSRRPVLRKMLRALEHAHPPLQSILATPPNRKCDFRMENGIDRVTEHLQMVFSDDPETREQMLRKAALSGRPSAAGPGADGSGDMDWCVLAQSEHHVLISTVETSHCKQIPLESVAVYGMGSEGLIRPALGKITRVLRTDQGQLLVEIRHLARFGTVVDIAAAVTDDAPGPRPGQAPSILAYDDSLGWCVICAPGNSLPVGCTIQIRTRRIQVDTRLRSLREITPHFLMFQLDAQQPRLTPPRYPSTRKRYRHSRLLIASQLLGEDPPNQQPRRRHRGA